uniref:Uncharacterized protein n=1 Tax=Timema poppense TaxID=170557 RepID=A0A7R9CYC7_TIMPO|nr:unnamed protein product [Timema poppensis]
MQQERFISTSVSNSTCLDVGSSSSDKGDVLPESSSTTGAERMSHSDTIFLSSKDASSLGTYLDQTSCNVLITEPGSCETYLWLARVVL